MNNEWWKRAKPRLPGTPRTPKKGSRRKKATFPESDLILRTSIRLLEPKAGDRPELRPWNE